MTSAQSSVPGLRLFVVSTIASILDDRPGFHRIGAYAPREPRTSSTAHLRRATAEPYNPPVSQPGKWHAIQRTAPGNRSLDRMSPHTIRPHCIDAVYCYKGLPPAHTFVKMKFPDSSSPAAPIPRLSWSVGTVLRVIRKRCPHRVTR